MIFSPYRVISLSFLLLFVLVVTFCHFSTATPWFGMSLRNVGGSAQIVHLADNSPLSKVISERDVLESAGAERIAIIENDLLAEPDLVSSYREYNQFLERQASIFSVLDNESVILHFQQAGEVVVSPASSRPLSDLPAIFWFQLMCGCVTFIAGAFVLAFRPTSVVTIFYAVSGLGLLLAAGSAAVYTTRELALDSEIFYRLSLLNQFGTSLFSGAFISILWYYPEPLGSRSVGFILVGSYVLLWLASYLQLSESLDLIVRVPLLVGLVINLVFALTQWRQGRADPVRRVILKWFLMAWLTGSTFYVGMQTVPLLLGLKPLLSQNLGWGVLVTVYFGIALGITRYRLFDLDRWVLQGWYWFVAGLVVIGFDLLLVSVLHFDYQLSGMISLALVGWVYFPVRQIISRRIRPRNFQTNNFQSLVPEVLSSALRVSDRKSDKSWEDLVKEIFLPLHIEKGDEWIDVAQIEGDGTQLVIPSVGQFESLRLSYAHYGRRLFDEDDRRLASSVALLFSEVMQFRKAFHRGVVQERKRIARDLHDDVASRLLTLIYLTEDKEHSDVARETLKELRDVIHNLELENYTLSRMLDWIRHDSTSKCQAFQVNLSWQQVEVTEEIDLTPRQCSNLVRIIRESITNALRHTDSDVVKVCIDMNGDALNIEISNKLNNGQDAYFKPGRGMSNITLRAKELAGSVEWITKGEEPVWSSMKVNVPLTM